MASNKFQEKFYNFINNIIIEYQKLNIDQENNSDDNNIILVNFIDDIDLNNNRCMEIIDLLLIYFSHPRIVNIISCDINTFKENITIEILKKEDLLYKEILDKNFLNPNNNFENILTRKNELSYEYLKKLLPPKYRFTLKNWSLKNRANFFCNYTKNKDEDYLTIENCLIKICEDKPLLKNYFKINNTLIFQLFNIFDENARGLSNVYFSLSSFYYYKIDAQNEDKNYNKELFYIRQLLENIVYSNKILNNYSDLIFKNMLLLDNNKENIIINFKTLKEMSIKLEANNFKDKKSFIKYFILFTFLDFSVRILDFKDLLKNNYYNDTKKFALIVLLKYPEISDNSILTEYNNIFLDKKYKNKNNEYFNLEENIDNKDIVYNGNLFLDLYLNLEFEKAIYLFNNINFEEISRLNFKNNSIEIFKYIIDIYNILKFSQTEIEKQEIENYITKNYSKEIYNINNIINLCNYIENPIIDYIEKKLFNSKYVYLDILTEHNNYIRILKDFVKSDFNDFKNIFEKDNIKYIETENKYEYINKRLNDINKILNKDNLDIIRNKDKNSFIKIFCPIENISDNTKNYIIDIFSWYFNNSNIDFGYKDCERLVYRFIENIYLDDYVDILIFKSNNESINFLNNLNTIEKNNINSEENPLLKLIEDFDRLNLWKNNASKNVLNSLDEKVSEFEDNYFLVGNNLSKKQILILNIFTHIIVKKINNKILNDFKKFLSDKNTNKKFFATFIEIFHLIDDISFSNRLFSFHFLNATIKYIVYKTSSNEAKNIARKYIEDIDNIILDKENLEPFINDNINKFKLLFCVYLYKNSKVNDKLLAIDVNLSKEFLNSIQLSRELKQITNDDDKTSFDINYKERTQYIEDLNKRFNPIESLNI